MTRLVKFLMYKFYLIHIIGWSFSMEVTEKTGNIDTFTFNLLGLKEVGNSQQVNLVGIQSEECPVQMIGHESIIELARKGLTTKIFTPWRQRPGFHKPMRDPKFSSLTASRKGKGKDIAITPHRAEDFLNCDQKLCSFGVSETERKKDSKKLAKAIKISDAPSIISKKVFGKLGYKYGISSKASHDTVSAHKNKKREEYKNVMGVRRHENIYYKARRNRHGLQNSKKGLDSKIFEPLIRNWMTDIHQLAQNHIESNIELQRRIEEWSDSLFEIMRGKVLESPHPLKADLLMKIQLAMSTLEDVIWSYLGILHWLNVREDGLNLPEGDFLLGAWDSFVISVRIWRHLTPEKMCGYLNKIYTKEEAQNMPIRMLSYLSNKPTNEVIPKEFIFIVMVGWMQRSLPEPFVSGNRPNILWLEEILDEIDGSTKYCVGHDHDFDDAKLLELNIKTFQKEKRLKKIT